MPNTIIFKEQLINKISDLTVIDQLVETIYVDKSIGQIDIQKTVKENDTLINFSEKIDFKLKSHRIIIKNSNGNNIVISDAPKSKTILCDISICKCISSDIDQIFISEIKSFRNTQKYTYNFYNQNILKKIINPNKKSDLIDKILSTGLDCSWVIIPEFIFNILKTSRLFTGNNLKSESSIYNAGCIGNLSVYVNPEENESMLYFGNYDSVCILINRDIKEESIKKLSFYKSGKVISVDYLFLERGITKSLHII
jgi:hypothetical protein